jgi:ribosome biogenesis GTPase
MTGLVVKSTGSWYAVRLANAEVIECRLKGKIRLDDRKTTNPVAVGDTVDIERNIDGNNQITISSVNPSIYPSKHTLLPVIWIRLFW